LGKILREFYINVFGRKYTLKILQSLYQSILDEFFSGRRGIVECEFIGESVAFKVRYIYELLKVFSKLSPLPSDPRVVDIGCERGDMLLLLQQLGFTKLSVINLTPYDSRWLVETKSYGDFFGDKEGQIRYITCDIDNNELPFGKGEVDIIILSDTFEHLSNPGWILSEVNRIMAKGGLMVIGTPNIASIRNRLYLLFGRTIHGDLESWLSTKFRLDGRYVGHFREYTLKELKFLVRNYGFEPISYKFVPTLTLLGKAREDIPSVLFKLYSFFEKVWPGGRHRIVMVAHKVDNKKNDSWIPVPHTVLNSKRLEKNAD
jgi:SAM-dependent methyltransferase